MPTKSEPCTTSQSTDPGYQWSPMTVGPQYCLQEANPAHNPQVWYKPTQQQLPQPLNLPSEKRLESSLLAHNFESSLKLSRFVVTVVTVDLKPTSPALVWPSAASRDFPTSEKGLSLLFTDIIAPRAFQDRLGSIQDLLRLLDTLIDLCGCLDYLIWWLITLSTLFLAHPRSIG